jgi:predicted metal-dependent phosphoesterase TrpH
MYLADFHIHTQFSDGSMSISEIIDFYGKRGFGAIAITDHLCEERSALGKAASYLGRTLTRNSFERYQEEIIRERNRAWQKYQMLVIPGFEVTKNSLINHRAAHIVALGVTEWISADLDVKDIARRIRDLGGLAIAAHPLSPDRKQNRPYYLWDRRDELRDDFDAWEVTYHSCLLSEVMDSDLPKIASSDLHKPHQINSWKTVLNCPRTQDAVFQSIRTQDSRVQFYSEEQKPLLEVLPALQQSTPLR